jgi:hypothetical protein
MTLANEVVFLLDVDNTRLDNDRIVAIAAYSPADITVERIGELVNYDLPALLGVFEAGHTEQGCPKHAGIESTDAL